MFCSSCGASLTTGLTYCNRCGARTAMSTNPLDVTNPREDKLVDIVHMTAIVSGAVAIGGFVFVFLLIDKLLEKAINPSALVVFLIFSLAAVFGISSLLIRQFSRVLSAYLGTGEKEKRRKLKERAAPQLEAPREPVTSVTENTTRAFEPALRESGQLIFGVRRLVGAFVLHVLVGASCESGDERGPRRGIRAGVHMSPHSKEFAEFQCVTTQVNPRLENLRLL